MHSYRAVVAALVALGSAVSSCLVAQVEQGEQSVEELRQRLLEMATNPEARAVAARKVATQLRLVATPRQATSAVVVMAASGDLIRLRSDKNDVLELHRCGPGVDDVPCGRWSVGMPGPFTARAFGANDIIVAMQMGNAISQTTVLCFTRPDGANDFELAAHSRVGRVAWMQPVPGEETLVSIGASAVAWDAATRTATMLFAWEGPPRVVVADVVLVPAAPPVASGGEQVRRRRSVLMPPPAVTVKGDYVGEGIDADALAVAGELHVFVRRGGGSDRESGVRVHVRQCDGKWSKPADASDLAVEREFTAWSDAEGRVCLTTPASEVRGDVLATSQLDLVQTLRTFRMDPQDPSKWTPAARQFTWSGPLLLGQRLCVVTTAGKTSVVLQTTTGQVVQQPIESEEPPRGK